MTPGLTFRRLPTLPSWAPLLVLLAIAPFLTGTVAGLAPAAGMAIETPDGASHPAPTHARLSARTETGRPSGAVTRGTPTAHPSAKDFGAAWETMTPLPAGRVFHAVIADNLGHIYVIGGSSDADGLVPTNTNYRYATTTDTWTAMAAAPTTFFSVDGAFLDGKIYIPGDESTPNTSVYDIATDSWSTITPSGGFTGRQQYQVVVVGTNLYVLGGIYNDASTTEVWVLNTLTGLWSAGVPMQQSRTSFAAGAIDGRIYVAGGVAFPGFTPDMTAEMFDGSTWSYIAAVPTDGGLYSRWSYLADGVGEDGLWLAAGRRDTNWNVLNHAGFYNPLTDTWTTPPTVPSLAQSRVYMEGAVAVNGYFHVIGGRDGDASTIYATNERLRVGHWAGGATTLQFDKTVDGSGYPYLAYTLIVTNTGSVAAEGIVLTDPIPSGTVYAAGSLTLDGVPVSDDPADGPGGYETGAGRVRLNLADIPPGVTHTVTFQVIHAQATAGTIYNQAQLTGDNVPPQNSDDPSTPGTGDSTGFEVLDPIPTLSGWGLLTVLLALAGLGAWRLRQS